MQIDDNSTVDAVRACVPQIPCMGSALISLDPDVKPKLLRAAYAHFQQVITSDDLEGLIENLTEDNVDLTRQHLDGADMQA